MKSLGRLFAVMGKELRQLRRDRLTFAMIIGIPIMQILLFGYAINTDVRNLKAAVADQADTHLSRQFVSDLKQTQVLDFQYVVETPMEIEELLRTGRVSAGVHIPYDFDRRVIDGNRFAAHLLVDGADPTIVGVANQLRSMRVNFDSWEAPSESAGILEVRLFYNPERRSAVYVVLA